MPSLNLFLNLVFEQGLFLRDFRLVRGINLRDLRSLCFGQWSDRRSLLQTFHREFIGRFHRYKESSKLDEPQKHFQVELRADPVAATVVAAAAHTQPPRYSCPFAVHDPGSAGARPSKFAFSIPL